MQPAPQVEVPCGALGAISEKLRNAICGPLGDASLAVGSAGYEFCKDNDMELAGAAVVFVPVCGAKSTPAGQLTR